MRLTFAPEQKARYHELLEEVFDSGFLSDGPMVKRFEEEFGRYVKLPARGISNGGSGLLAAMHYLDVAGHEVIVPANTFWATARAPQIAGAKVVYGDCNREDLCLSLDDLKRKVTTRTKAVILVHIGGHLAFQSAEIAEFCRQKGIALVEDCAHVHGGWWNGKTGGHYGFAGVYSFYATKTMPTGEGGMVVSGDPAFLSWLEKYRNYGKEVIDGVVTYPIMDGFNYRLSDLVAAFGVMQLERLPEVLQWKQGVAAKFDKIFANRVRFPDGMISGYYKYIVFNYPKLKQSTGQVFGPLDLGPNIENVAADIPNSIWVAEQHQCPPIWYGWESSGLSPTELKALLLGVGNGQ
jgi:perosamine synthetase